MTTKKKPTRRYKYTVISWDDDQTQMLADWVTVSNIAAIKRHRQIQNRRAYAVPVAIIRGHVIAYDWKK
jgi:hypothetical protein